MGGKTLAELIFDLESRIGIQDLFDPVTHRLRRFSPPPSECYSLCRNDGRRGLFDKLPIEASGDLAEVERMLLAVLDVAKDTPDSVPGAVDIFMWGDLALTHLEFTRYALLQGDVPEALRQSRSLGQHLQMVFDASREWLASRAERQFETLEKSRRTNSKESARCRAEIRRMAQRMLHENPKRSLTSVQEEIAATKPIAGRDGISLRTVKKYTKGLKVGTTKKRRIRRNNSALLTALHRSRSLTSDHAFSNLACLEVISCLLLSISNPMSFCPSTKSPR